MMLDNILRIFGAMVIAFVIATVLVSFFIGKD